MCRSAEAAQSSRFADLSLSEDALLAGGRHVLVAYNIRRKIGYDYLASAVHFAARISRCASDDGVAIDDCEVPSTDDFSPGTSVCACAATGGLMSNEDTLVYFIDLECEVAKIAFPVRFLTTMSQTAVH